MIFFDQRGSTLIELIVTLGIFALVIGAVGAIFMTSFQSKDIVFEQLNVQNQARKAIQDFTNEFRSATQSSIGAYPIEYADGQQITFYSNIDADSLRERVRYFVQGSNLQKGVIKPTGSPLSYVPANEVVTTIVQSLTNTSTPIFTYYGQTYDGVSNKTALASPVDLSAIRVVKMSLTIDKSPVFSPAPLLVEGMSEARNLKSN